MSVQFDANTTDKITVTNPQTFGAGTAFSFYQWWRKTANPTNGQGTSKDVGAGNDLFVFFNNWFSNVGRATTNANAQISSGDIYTNNVWYFTAVTYDESNGVQIFNGTLTSIVAEASYLVFDVGSGNTSADSSDLFINNRLSSSANAVPEDLAIFHWIARRLTLAELVTHQFKPRIDASSKFFFIPNVTGTIPDWSGHGNSGTGTGLALSDSVPLGPIFGRKLDSAFFTAISAARLSRLVLLGAG